MSKLVCPECRHENEAERIYCHNCGARLNRPAAISEKTEEAKTLAAREHLRRMLDNRGVKARQLALNIAKLILGSIVAAVLILMFLTPDIPPSAGKDLELGPQIGLDLENAIMQHNGAQKTYTENQVNSYLATAFKRKKTSVLDKPMLEFRRGIAQFDEGGCRITLERSLFGLSVYTSEFYHASVEGGKIMATTEGGAIGRMPIHPQLMQFANFLVSDAWKALEQDRKQVEKLAAIEFHPKSVILTGPAQ